MRFKTIAFALIVSSAVFILGCDDEDSSTIGGGGRVYFEATVSPPMDSAILQFGMYPALFQSGTSATLVGGTYTSDEMSVTKGQNLPVMVSLAYTNYINGSRCSNVQIKTFLNGSQIDVRTYNMGNYIAGPIFAPPCPDGNQKNYNLIVP